MSIFSFSCEIYPVLQGENPGPGENYAGLLTISYLAIPLCASFSGSRKNSGHNDNNFHLSSFPQVQANSNYIAYLPRSS